MNTLEMKSLGIQELESREMVEVDFWTRLGYISLRRL